MTNHITQHWLRRTDSPIGRLELTSDGMAITSLTIERDGRLPLDAERENSNRVLERAADQLGAYFNGRRRSFSVPLAARGTQFQHAIWDQLSALEWGEVTSYGELGSDGRVTGYSCGKGIPTKLWLLEHEGVLLSA